MHQAEPQRWKEAVEASQEPITEEVYEIASRAVTKLNI